jgi:hypothetical protein
MFPAAIAPPVWGDFRGSARARVVPLGTAIDAAHLASAPPAKAHVVGRSLDQLCVQVSICSAHFVIVHVAQLGNMRSEQPPRNGAQGSPQNCSTHARKAPYASKAVALAVQTVPPETMTWSHDGVHIEKPHETEVPPPTPVLTALLVTAVGPVVAMPVIAPPVPSAPMP